jgi:hypothetical protein
LTAYLATGAAALVACSLGLMLAVAGAQKLALGDRYDEILAAHGVLPARAIPAVRVVLPWAELALALWLWSLYALLPACMTLFALLAAFLVYRVGILRKGTRTGCGCFGDVDGRHSAAVRVGAATIYLVVALAGTFGARAAVSPPFLVHLTTVSLGALAMAALLRGAIRVHRTAVG